MDYANTTNVEFIVDPKVLFHGWLIYSYLQIFELIKYKWLPGECADWFFDNIITWYCLHRRYSMSRQKNGLFVNEHALNREPVPLKFWQKKKHEKPDNQEIINHFMTGKGGDKWCYIYHNLLKIWMSFAKTINHRDSLSTIYNADMYVVRRTT